MVPFSIFKDLPWLAELHDKLWGRADLFHQVFRAVDLTKDDFIELQSNLHHLNPSRNHKNYVAGNVLETKINFLRSRTATHRLTTTTDSLVPKVVLHSSEGLIPADTMYVDVSINSEKIVKQQEHCEDKEFDEDSEGEVDDEDDNSYIYKDAAILSNGPTAVLPCTIRYMDLTCLNLQYFTRVSRVLLIRDEWDAVVDIFNKREIGIEGSVLWTGQEGTGKQYYSPWVSRCN
jgi:hypothetical protein